MSAPVKEKKGLDTGEMLRAYCKQKRIYKAALARKMDINYQNIFTFLKSSTIDVNKLANISHALQHNFLMDIAVQLPAHYSTNAPANNSKEEEIADLKKQ